MPTRPPHPCATPGCPTLVPRGGRCAEHRKPWSGSRRADTLPADWDRIRTRILRRDGHRCQLDRCGQPARQVDHITPAHLGGTDHDTNLRAICDPCHALKSAREGRAAQLRSSTPT